MIPRLQVLEILSVREILLLLASIGAAGDAEFPFQ